MSPLATTETEKSVDALIDSIESESKQEDARALIDLFTEVSGTEPKVWGDNYIIGFGKYTYQRKGGKEEYEWFNMGFAPRKSKITLYLTMDISEYQEILDRLGKHKIGKGCLYINRLSDVDMDVLRELIQTSKDNHWQG